MCADNPAITCAVDVDSRVVEESVQQTAQLSVSAFTEAFSQLLLDTVDGGDAGGNARLSLLGQGDQLGPPICRVRAADDVAECSSSSTSSPIARGDMFARRVS